MEPTPQARALARAALASILRENGGGDTLADLSRSLYKYTEAGISLAAKRWNGHCIWNGTAPMRDAATIDDVSHLGLSSIVEGSDAEVPVQWVDLTDPEAPAKFWKLADEVDSEACALWDEAHADDTEH